MYTNYYIQNDKLIVKDEKGIEYIMSNSEYFLSYLKNENDIEMLEDKLKKVKNLERTISTNLWKLNIKKRKKIINLLMITLLLMATYQFSGIMLFGIVGIVGITSIAISIGSTVFDEKYVSVDKLIELSDEIEKYIEKLKKENEIILELDLTNKNKIKHQNGVVGIDTVLENKFENKIKYLLEMREYLLESKNDKTFVKTPLK